MNRWLVLLGALMCATGARAFEPTVPGRTNVMLASFELKDQHQLTHRFAFPRTNLLILTVADQKGSKQVAAWVRPLKERFPHGLPIEGVADLSIVPAFLRPLVRREFKSQFEHPVMLDWSGDVVKRLPCASDAANVFLVATNGAVLWQHRGPVETNRLAELIQLIEAGSLKGSSLGPESPEGLKCQR